MGNCAFSLGAFLKSQDNAETVSKIRKINIDIRENKLLIHQVSQNY